MTADRPDDRSDVSDALLAESDAVKHLEREKRKLPTSSPEFRRIAEEIERRARHVFHLGDEADRGEPPATATEPGEGLERDP